MYQPDFTICHNPEEGNRCISTCGTPLSVVKRYLEAKQVFFNLADRLLAPSRLLIEIFHRLEWGREIHLVKHGYLYNEVPPIRAASQRKGPVRVGYLGAVSHVKGVDYLIDCFKQVTEDNIELDIYGGHIDDEGVVRSADQTGGQRSEDPFQRTLRHRGPAGDPERTGRGGRFLRIHWKATASWSSKAWRITPQ